MVKYRLHTALSAIQGINTQVKMTNLACLLRGDRRRSDMGFARVFHFDDGASNASNDSHAIRIPVAASIQQIGCLGICTGGHWGACNLKFGRYRRCT